MITIKHSYGADLDWIVSFAKGFGGITDGNFIYTDNHISTGTRYFLNSGEEDVVLLFIDVTYNTDLHVIQAHEKQDFIGLYFNLTKGQTFKATTDLSYDIGMLGYDVSIIDSLLETEYYISSDTTFYGICIFIKKFKIKSFAKKNENFAINIDKIMDADKNTFIKFDCMSAETFTILNNLRKMDVGGELFNLNLMAAGYHLISNYIDQILHNDVIEKVNNVDLLNIINVQRILINNIQEPFPSVKTIAEKANMSETKFKKLFKKITGMTPNNFYLAHKLEKAKELLEIKTNTITSVCDELQFSSYDYFIFQFRKYFGISPNAFIKKM